jgi:RNA polymerase sigma factor (TIGR02999 family)
MAENDVRSQVTRILQRPDPETPTVDRLLPLVYPELRRLALNHLRRERENHTLSPTALVHEAYLRLAGGAEVSWESRAHFFGAAARAMRQILVDHARIRGAAKRGGGWRRVTLEEEFTPSGRRHFDFLDLHNALEKLMGFDERAARTVELRFFGGLTLDEVAHVLGVSRRTVAGDWTVARMWLSRELFEKG